MIKFFREIRQNLLTENKYSKYFLYAIGEILLVVIGILIALSVSNWNASENLSKKELALFASLKNDIDLDIISLKSEDSRYEKSEASSKKSIELFYKARTIKDLDSVYLMTKALWNELYINQNTYNEMISSGSLYSIKNKELQKKITKYYLQAEADKIYIRDVNTVQSRLWELNSDIISYKFLIDLPENHKINLQLIDTTWINNPNSKTYLGVINYLKSNFEANNVYRRSVFKRTLKQANILTEAIEQELKHRNK